MRDLRSLACVGLLAILMAGCGGSNSQRVTIEATPAALRKAAQATLDKGTAKLEMTLELSGGGEPETLRATGAMDQRNQRLQVDFDEFSEVIDGTVIYLHVPRAAIDGKEWFKIDLATNSAFSELLESGGGSNLDPTAFIQFLEGVGKVTEVSREDVRSVSTRHFSGTYTLKDVLASLAEDQRARIQRLFGQLPASALEQELSFDAWIDDDGLLRRVRTSMDSSMFGSATSSQSDRASTTVEFFDFGQPVNIDVPREDEVQDYSVLAADASSTFGSVSSSIN